jgi:DNA-binding MarR family transcriptional regulator
MPRPTPRRDVAQVLAHYPRIYLACHRRHVRDPRTGALLSAHQASILDHLDAVDPTTLTDLAQHMGVTPGTMSVAVDRLVRGGYVSRAADEADRRRVQLRLSEAGVRIKSASSVLDPALVRAMLAQLGDADRADALRGLSLLARAADAMRASAGRDTSRSA